MFHSDLQMQLHCYGVVYAGTGDLASMISRNPVKYRGGSPVLLPIILVIVLT